MTITRRLPAFPLSLLHLPASLSPTLFSEGHCLRVAHFFLREAKLLLSKAICFLISVERMTQILVSIVISNNLGQKP